VTLLLAVGLLLLVVLIAIIERENKATQFRVREGRDVMSASNLVANPLFYGSTDDVHILHLPGWVISGTMRGVTLTPFSSLASNYMAVRPGHTYIYSVKTYEHDGMYGLGGHAQVRLLWLDDALEVLSWNDSPVWYVTPSKADPSFLTGSYVAPEGAARLRFELRNVSEATIWVNEPKVSQVGVYIEQHPNGAQGSIAFSFDWESAMGGAIHSKGMVQHDPQAAEQHGIEMRQGADWLKELFAQHGIKATFYGTGYNLLDGNEQRRIFSGDPIYRWASPEFGWGSDYWLTHKWYSDDPYATYETEPAWYFGDQARALLGAGHEIAPHTFGHLYVRGSNPQELAADMDEWLKAAKEAGVPPPTTFAFPWRSSNSLTQEYYDVLRERGIQAVTRIYEGNIRDLYTLSATCVLTGGKCISTRMAVMPDFLLGVPSVNAGEEAAGSIISREKALEVISETLARRGTTSFWQHPEQLAPKPEFEGVRKAWEEVVAEAAQERERGRLWIAPVADIVAYQRDVMSVTARLDKAFLGGWKVEVRNDSGKELSGVTLTLPGDVVRASSNDVDVLTVNHPDAKTTRVSTAKSPVYPASQLVLDKLKPGVANIEVEWAAGQEPLR
jgi:peptidoglycan/xylan/chitin deacetylase (PgdA/CDA1 family)